jgi:glycosyltransferase involved in cell wall biosynthesis
MKPLVAVIAYNEEENIVSTLQDLKPYRDLYDFVVIDNCSTDRTAALSRKLNIVTLRHFVNTGDSFGTVQTYFRYAFEKGYQTLCQFDGDGQHLASQLNAIVEPIVNDKADYVIGSRFIEKKGFQSFFFRRLGIRLFAVIDSWIIGHPLTDVTSGFRAYGSKVIDLFGNRVKTQIHDINQLLLTSHFAGARIMEVPIVMRERRHGISEFNAISALTYPLKGVVNILGCVLQKEQTKYMTRNYRGIQD